MKNLKSIAALCLVVFAFLSCEKDEGLSPEMNFKTGSGYTSADQTMAGGTAYKIGIDAAKSEKHDVLKKFNISKSVNGGSQTSVYDKDLSSDEEDNYSYDYNGTLETTAGTVVKLTFTVTNRDGIVNQKTITLTVQ